MFESTQSALVNDHFTPRKDEWFEQKIYLKCKTNLQSLIPSRYIVTMRFATTFYSTVADPFPEKDIGQVQNAS